MLHRAFAVVVVALLLGLPAAAQNAGTLSIEGKVKHPQKLTLDALRKLPSQRIDVTYETDKGPVKANFAGVLVWSLIGAAGGIDDAGHGSEVRHAIRVTASDGYAVIISVGEIAPQIGGRAAMIAYERDGKPLDNFYLATPGDKSDARYVHHVTTITVE
jgi:hypothetical protein